MFTMLLKVLVTTVVLDCDEAIDKFNYKSMLKMSLVDIDIARLRLIPFYYNNCKKNQKEWENVANEFDSYYYKNVILNYY